MAERLTFTLTGRDELSRVLNGTADSADRLRLRLAGITADADGRLRDLRGRFLSVDEAIRRLGDPADAARDALANLRDEAGRLGEAVRSNVVSLLPAAIPAAAGLASSAAVLAGQLGAVAVAAGAYALALGPQISAIGEALEAQEKYEQAVEESGATSQEAIKAQVAYQRQLEKLPPATREAAIAVGLLKDNFQEWSDELSGDVMAPFIKGVAVTNALLPKTTGLVKGASAQFDRLITLVGGAIATPGFDRLTERFTSFTEQTLRRGVDGLTIFLAKAQAGELDNSRLTQWMDYARQNGPVIWDTLENIGDALLNVLEAGADVGVGMLQVVNVLSNVVSAVPPEAISTFLQLAVAIKAVRLAAAGTDAARAALLALGTQVAALRASAAGAPSAISGVTAAIGGLSRGAKLAMAGTGIGLLLVVLDQLSAASQKPQPDVDRLSTSLVELGRSGKVTGEALRVYGRDLGGLADSLQKVIDPEGLDQVQQSLTKLIGMDSTPVANAKKDIDALDQALANMVSSGQADLAAAALDKIVANLKKQGFTSDEVRGQMDAYKAALAGQALEQQLAAEAMGLFGQQAQETRAKLDAQKQSADGLRESIEALNDANRNALGGMIAFEASIDAAAKAAKENAGSLDMVNGRLDVNSPKAQAAATALNDLAAKTKDAALSARENGESWDYVNSIYERGRQQLIKNAMQMGLTRSEAKALADQILKTPDKTAKLRGDMEDLQRKINDAKAKLKSVPDSRKAKVRADIEQLERQLEAARRQLNGLDGKTATTYVVTQYIVQGATGEARNRSRLRPGHYAQGGPIGRYAQGGPVPGFPEGGLLVGPGTSTSDSIPILASTGEYIVKAAAVAKYGLKFMDALNEGRLPVGLPVGRAARPGLPAAPSAAAPVAGSDRPPVTYNIYPRKSIIDVEDLRLLQRQEEARQRVGRPS